MTNQNMIATSVISNFVTETMFNWSWTPLTIENLSVDDKHCLEHHHPLYHLNLCSVQCRLPESQEKL